MAVKRLTADAQLFAQVGDDGASLAHGGLRKTELGRRHLRLAATVASARAGGCESGDRAFPDQLELELRERREDAEHQFAGRGRRLQTPQPCPPFGVEFVKQSAAMAARL